MIHLAPMEPEDVLWLKNWGQFEDDLFKEYNFGDQENFDHLAWYRWKTGYFLSDYLTIFLDDRPIGYVGFKTKLRVLGFGVLGVVLGPDYLDRGYGTVALELFLKYAFLKESLRVLYLVVAPYNLRGQHVYEKLGFQRAGIHYYRYPFKDLPTHHREFAGIWEEGIQFLGAWYLPGIRMKLKREDYLERRGL